MEQILFLFVNLEGRRVKGNYAPPPPSDSDGLVTEKVIRTLLAHSVEV